MYCLFGRPKIKQKRGPGWPIKKTSDPEELFVKKV